MSLISLVGLPIPDNRRPKLRVKTVELSSQDLSLARESHSTQLFVRRLLDASGKKMQKVGMAIPAIRFF